MLEVTVSRIDVSTGKLDRRTDIVAEEAPLHIFLNTERYTTILCSPNQLKELAIGHLLSEGILKSTTEIKEVRSRPGGKLTIRLNTTIDIEKRLATSQPFARLIVSACGAPNYWPVSRLIDRLKLPYISSHSKINAKTVLASVKRLNTISKIFKKTGAVHIAALYSTNGALITFAEDVGRHNAVDKVVGSAALKSLNLDKCLLACSGRLTGGIVLKAARMKIPIVASLAAALNSGMDIAQETGITLIGFVRGKRMNVYTHPERIDLTQSIHNSTREHTG